VEKVNAKEIDLSAITSGTSNRGAKERGWIFNLDFFKNIKKQDPRAFSRKPKGFFEDSSDSQREMKYRKTDIVKGGQERRSYL
jgi:hypothetical protein